MPNSSTLTTRRAFQRMWVAGTLGAFFTAFVRNIPADIHTLHASPAGVAILDRSLRYGYLLWLLAYFFITNLLNEQGDHPTTRELVFDVIQSISGLTAAYLLGFIAQNTGLATTNHSGAVVAANAVILVIALTALFLFRQSAMKNLNRLRLTGAGLAALSLAVGLLPTSAVVTLILAGLSQLGLWGTLYLYIRLRLGETTTATTAV